MPERPVVHVPPPGRDRSPTPEPPETPRPVPDDEDDDDELDDGASALFDRAWPDDDDEPTVPDPLVDETVDPLDAPVPEEEDLPLAPEDEAALDVLEDLGAPDDTEIPVIDTELEVRVDGVPSPARVEWGRDRTLLVRPAGAQPDRDAVLEIGGQRVRARIGVVAGDQAVLLLGRDVLKGRFLLRA